MDFKDRTNEFTAITECLRKQQQGGTTNLLSSSTATTHKIPLLSTSSSSGILSQKHHKTQFALIAAAIGRDIHRTSEKLARLAELSKTTSLFSEQTIAPQIQRLIGEVNTEIYAMTQQLDVLNREAETLQNEGKHYINLPSAASLSSSKQSQMGEHATTVVSVLKLKLGETTTMFRDVLQTRTESLKVQQEWRQRYAGTSLIPTSRAISSPLYKTNSTTRSSSGNIDDEESKIGTTENDSDVSIAMPQMSATSQMERYYGMRTEAVKQIETSMTQLQGVFTQLAGIVADHGEMLERIDHNVDTAVMDVTSAHERLVRQLHKLSQNRWLIIKIFSVLIVTIIIFVIFFL